MNECFWSGFTRAKTPDNLIRRAWVGALLVLVLGLILAIARDRVDGATEGRATQDS
jgi:hypothetical protein